MATWNDKNEGDELEECRVCMVKVCKKRMTMHLNECCEKHAEWMDEVKLIRCPLYPLHILPEKHLNHHLEGNCEEAMNLLRKYFQKNDLETNIKLRPPTFAADVPDEILNQNNKQLLYMLKRDIHGNDVSNNTEYYPPEPPEQYMETDLIAITANGEETAEEKVAPIIEEVISPIDESSNTVNVEKEVNK